MLTAYLTPADFFALPNGGDYSQLLTGYDQLTVGATLGGTTLTVSSGSQFVAGTAYVFDGASSEEVLISGVVGNVLSVTAVLGSGGTGPLQAAHAAGTQIAQGPQANGLPSGSSLPFALMVSSSWIENFTQRKLLRQTISNEQGKLILDKNNFLILKPNEWPISAFTAITVIGADGAVYSGFDPTQVYPIARHRVYQYTGPTGSYCPGIPLRRGMPGWVQISYVAGHQPLPLSILEAAQLTAMEICNRQDNYLGASAVQIDHTRIETRLRGDDGFDNIFIAQAKERLNSYVRRD